jgi:hypothetical protein
VDLVCARADNRAQYIRSSAVVSGSEPDSASVLAIYDEALDGSWRNSHALRFRRAEYLRYIWKLEEAIDGFRQVKAAAISGDTRRDASGALARALLATSLHSDLEEPERVRRLGEAAQLVSEIDGDFEQSRAAAMLKDHISLELGEPVDWATLDDVRTNVIGDGYDFPTKLLQDFDEVKDRQTATAHNAVELLANNFADPDVIGLSGMLYLRRAVKRVGNDQLKDFASALGFFFATSVLERSWDGNERPLTSFRIGLAILEVSEQLHSLNPIPHLKIPSKLDQLGWGVSRLQSAASRSTGVLRTASLANVKRAYALRASIVRELVAEQER